MCVEHQRWPLQNQRNPGKNAYYRYTTLQRDYTENSKQIFPEMKLRGLSPNSYIHVSVSDLYIPRIDLPILLQENRWTIYKVLTDT
jgi:hypothetical protein